MLTRCPDCATHFRVTAEQLKLRAGRVRCGECQHVFNALDTLIEEPPVIIAPVPPRPHDPEPFHPAGSEDAAIPPAPPIESGEAAAATTEGQPQAPDGNPAESSGGDSAAPAIAEFPPEYLSNESPPWDEAQVEPPPRRWPWIVGSLLALLALGLQAILMYRVEVAVLLPESRPILDAACQALGCEVGLPARVALVGIEASDLHPDSLQKGRLALTATLKNRAPFAQRFPHLELTLTDTADKAIVRKVLAPADYLPPGTNSEIGMASNADIAISIALDVGDIPASGYRLYIFYP